MSKFFHVLKPRYKRDGQLKVSQEPVTIDNWRVEFSSVGRIPARTAVDALVIAKALGHSCPIVAEAELAP
jgi:hypothetical protein